MFIKDVNCLSAPIHFYLKTWRSMHKSVPEALWISCLSPSDQKTCSVTEEAVPETREVGSRDSFPPHNLPVIQTLFPPIRST